MAEFLFLDDVAFVDVHVDRKYTSINKPGAID